MNTILRHYIECALWASTNDDGDPIDLETLHESAKAQMGDDITNFLTYLEEKGISRDEWSDEQLGHDFWLSRNGHCAGFWDRGLENGRALHEAAKTFGSCDLYVGDDGLVYLY